MRKFVKIKYSKYFENLSDDDRQEALRIKNIRRLIDAQKLINEKLNSIDVADFAFTYGSGSRKRSEKELDEYSKIIAQKPILEEILEIITDPRQDVDDEMKEYILTENGKDFINDDGICRDCLDRDGEKGTDEYFETIGKPGSGFSMCGSECGCKIFLIEDGS